MMTRRDETVRKYVAGVRRIAEQSAAKLETNPAAEVQRWPERFTPWLRIYLDEHKDRIFGTLVRV